MHNKYVGMGLDGQVVTIIGSTKFKDRFLEAAKNLELLGCTVTHTHLFSHADGYELCDTEMERAVKNGHNRILDADIVLVVGDYYGESTREEIQYAKNRSKPIVYEPVTLAVHDGVFHADDVLCAALLKLNYQKEGKERSVDIVRTRDDDLLNSADYVCDVGGVTDFNNRRFDHHEADGDRETYPNGIKMAACGKLASYLYAQDQKYLEYLRTSVLYAVEAQDNGQDISEFGKFANPLSWVSLFNINWDENPATAYHNFLHAVDTAALILKQIEKRYYSNNRATSFLSEYLNRYNNDHILIMDRFVPWKDQICNYNKTADCKIYLVIFPNMTRGYNVQVVPESADTFTSYVSMPTEWRGKKDQELSEASGIKRGIFSSNFLSIWETEESAIQAANKILG